MRRWLAGRWRLGLEWAAVYAVSFAVVHYFIFQTRLMPETDGFFHIRTAALLREQGLFLKGFPWAQFSIWKEGYADGCFLYHLFLIPFTFGDLIEGAKLATAVLSAFMFSSFFVILTLNQVRARFFWFWLFFLGGEFFWWRMLVPRPQVMSVSFLMWSLHFLLNDRKRPFWVLSFLYPLAYVAAFVPLLFAGIRWLYLKIAEGRSEHKILLGGAGAFVAALVLHPYFPKNLMFFYVQNLYVMYMAVTQKVNLYLGMEFFPLDTRRVFFSHLPLVSALLFTLFGLIHRRKALSEKTRVLFPCALLVIFMTFMSKRFTEYAVPVTTLFCALAFTDVFHGVTLKEVLRRYRNWAWAFAAVAGIFLGVWTYRWHMVVKNDMSTLGLPRFSHLVRTLAEKVPAGETIYTCDWDEPPELYFYNPQHRYLVMMDPTFMYYWDPVLWQRWFDVSNMRVSPDEAVRVLREEFGVHYGLCGQKFQAFRSWIGRDPRFRILDESPQAFVFQLL